VVKVLIDGVAPDDGPVGWPGGLRLELPQPLSWRGARVVVAWPSGRPRFGIIMGQARQTWERGMARYLRCLACAAVVLLVAGGARADFEAGQHAWDAGRPMEAVEHWQAAADAGDGRAMLALGRLYVQGLGVIQNYVEAHKWFNLAASRGEMEALSERDTLAAQMTPQQVATAQELAASWLSGPDPAADAPAAAAAPAPFEPESLPPAAVVREAQALLTVLGMTPV